MRYLRKATNQVVTVGPAIASSNGFSLVTGLTMSDERITFAVDSGSTTAPTLALNNITGSSDSSNAIDYVSSAAGLLGLRLDSTNTNYTGRAFLTITNSTHCPIFHEFTILDANVYDSFVLQTDRLQVESAEIGSSAMSTLVGYLYGSTVESTFTFRESMQLQNAAAAAKISGSSGSTTILRDLADTLNRVTAVTDTNGNRETVTYNFS